MKKITIISVFSLAALIVISCSDVKRERGRAYMPDMADSRAYETYADHSNLGTKGIKYNAQSVNGTVPRGAELPYHLPNDSSGYAQSFSLTSPLPKLADSDMVEAERLYLINCAICHGAKLDGNGPLYNGGNGPYAAKPATLVGDPNYEKLPEGTIFHVQTYGKNLMGSYSSQLSRKQRWMVAQYIKSRQGGANPAGGADSTAAAASSAPQVAGSTGGGAGK